MIITASTNLNMEEPADQDDVGKGHERKKDSCWGTMTCQSALDSEDGSVLCPVELKNESRDPPSFSFPGLLRVSITRALVAVQYIDDQEVNHIFVSKHHHRHQKQQDSN